MAPVQNLQLGGRQSKSRYQYTLQSVTRRDIGDWANKFMERMRADPMFRDVTSDSQNKGLQATLDIDRDKANLLGVQMGDVRTALYAAFGERQVVDHLLDRGQLPRDPGSGRRGPPVRGRAVAPVGAQQDRPAGAAVGVRDRQAHGRPDRPSTTRASCRRSRCRSTWRRTCRWATPPPQIDQIGPRHEAAGRRSSPSYGGDAAVFQDSQSSQLILIVAAVLRDLRAAGRAVRELHPPADHPGRPAVGGGRRAADAAAVRLRPDADRHHRHPDADRHRQEERDHDDRLRARRAAQRGHDAGRRRSARPASCASARS